MGAARASGTLADAPRAIEPQLDGSELEAQIDRAVTPSRSSTITQ
jgi:hypothetical protein